MAQLKENKIDVRALESLYATTDVAKAVFNDFSNRQNNAGETKVERLESRLRQAGHEFSRRDVVWFLKELEKAGCGTFVIGRRGQPSRFEWAVQMISVAKAAKGEQLSVAQLDPSETRPAEEEDLQAGTLRHPYRLRRDLTITLDLPTDLTVKEAGRLADFIRTLPFGETVMA